MGDRSVLSIYLLWEYGYGCVAQEKNIQNKVIHSPYASLHVESCIVGLPLSTYLQLGWVLYSLFNHIGPNHLVQRTFCRISIGYPLDSTECPVGFYWTSTRILQVCCKCLRIANFIEKCKKNSYWTSSRISIGHPLESTRRPLEQKIWQSILLFVSISGNTAGQGYSFSMASFMVPSRHCA